MRTAKPNFGVSLKIPSRPPSQVQSVVVAESHIRVFCSARTGRNARSRQAAAIEVFGLHQTNVNNFRPATRQRLAVLRKYAANTKTTNTQGFGNKPASFPVAEPVNDLLFDPSRQRLVPS